MDIKEAFDRGAENYDTARKQLIPCFDDFYGTALSLIPFLRDEKIKALDLGAGTGLFSSLVSTNYPDASFTLYDISEGMLGEAEKRFKDKPTRVKFKTADYAKDDIEKGFDLIISALSIHHLSENEKRGLFPRIYESLNKKGIFINADQVLGDNLHIEKEYRKSWINQVKERGVSDEALNSALERMKKDKMSTLSAQLDHMRNAGFVNVNNWYQNFSFVVYTGSKV